MSKSNRFQSAGYDNLSLKDLLEARDLYHVHLMNRPNVVATAVGRYRIRIQDSWPGQSGGRTVHGKGERTLENSEVRPYSWPCVLAFVNEWVGEEHFSGRAYSPDDMVPKTLYMPDGRKVPVCVVKAPRQEEAPMSAPKTLFPLNNLGGGFPVIAEQQGRQHVATVACLATDGHKVYALTNRHVAGDAGEVIFSKLSGSLRRIGVSSAKQLSRMRFEEVYPGWVGSNVFVNLDVGLIDIDDLNDWTASIRQLGTLGPMYDLSTFNFSLGLLDEPVVGFGCAGGFMKGEIHAFFYRYKSQGGLDYVSDFLIGPRHAHNGEDSPLRTEPGDSGTLWAIETEEGDAKLYLPLAIQWGTHLLRMGTSDVAQPFVMATCLSTVCELLDIDVVRDWGLDQPDTWGSIGHFSIAANVARALSDAKLKKLMERNADIISPDPDTIRKQDFKGMGSDRFVPLSDVPDMFWKPRVSHQGYSRHFEGPNHFADMDQKRDDGEDLLSLCKNPDNVDPDVWSKFYDSVADILTGAPISPEHRGLLPFRVWQIFDAMMKFADEEDVEQFVCAAGVLCHYIGDACQPLHISYLHDGDPENPTSRTIHHNDGTTEQVTQPLGAGVHSAYEDGMVNLHRDDILNALPATKKVRADELIPSGFEAATATITLMRNTFKRVPPGDIVDAYVQFGHGGKALSEFLWKRFGTKTIRCMQDGVHLLAVLWQSAWKQGGGTAAMAAATALSKDRAMEICADREFLPSMTVDKIGSILKQPQSP